MANSPDSTTVARPSLRMAAWTPRLGPRLQSSDRSIALRGPTQTSAVARRQAEGGEIWGRTPRGSSWPQVRAYRGPLPEGTRGIEFWTATAPDASGHPDLAVWSDKAHREKALTDGEFVKLKVVVTRNTQ